MQYSAVEKCSCVMCSAVHTVHRSQHQVVVDHHVHPAAVLPELEVEDAAVLGLAEALQMRVKAKLRIVFMMRMTWSSGTTFRKTVGISVMPVRAQRNQQLPRKPWFTSFLLEPAIRNLALGKRVEARSQEMSSILILVPPLMVVRW